VQERQAQQWRSSLQTYAFPVLGALLVRHVELPHILTVMGGVLRHGGAGGGGVVPLRRAG